MNDFVKRSEDDCERPLGLISGKEEAQTTHDPPGSSWGSRVQREASAFWNDHEQEVGMQSSQLSPWSIITFKGSRHKCWARSHASQIIKNVARGSWRAAGAVVSGSSTKGGKRCADWGHGVKILQVHVQAEHDRHTCQTQTTSCH